MPTAYRVPTIPKLRCKRCEHRWVPRQSEITICPACKSRHWQTKRENDQGLRTDLKTTSKKGQTK